MKAGKIQKSPVFATFLLAIVSTAYADNEESVWRGDVTPEALDLIGQPVVATQGYTGRGTSVAVLDNLIYLEDLRFGDCDTPASPNGFSGWAPMSPNANNPCKIAWVQCFGSASCDPVDDQAIDTHGSSVSRVVVGVAPDTRIVFLSFGTGTREGDVIDAVNWLQTPDPDLSGATPVDHFNLVATSTSIGIERFSAQLINWEAFTQPCTAADLLPAESVWLDAWSALRDAGVVAVSAAGNNGWKHAVNFSACSEDILAVGSVYDRDLNTWTNFHDANPFLVLQRFVGQFPCQDGEENVQDTYPRARQVTCYSNNRSGAAGILAPGSLDGTSGAAPYVAGAVAVLRAANLWFSAGPDEIIDLLRRTGSPVVDDRSCRGAGLYGADPHGFPWPDEAKQPPYFVDNDLDPSDWLPKNMWPFTGVLNHPSRPNCLYADPFFEDVDGDRFPVEPDFFWDNVPDFEQRLINLEAAVNAVRGDHP